MGPSPGRQAATCSSALGPWAQEELEPDARLAAALAAQQQEDAIRAYEAALPPPLEPSHLLIDRLRIYRPCISANAHAAMAGILRTDAETLRRYLRCGTHEMNCRSAALLHYTSARTRSTNMD
jgi:hypothetical protein